MLKQLDRWHKTKSGLLVFAVIELALAYWFASLAIDKGNFLYYLLALIFLVGALQNFFRLIGALTRAGRRKAN